MRRALSWLAALCFGFGAGWLARPAVVVERTTTLAEVARPAMSLSPAPTSENRVDVVPISTSEPTVADLVRERMAWVREFRAMGILLDIRLLGHSGWDKRMMGFLGVTDREAEQLDAALTRTKSEINAARKALATTRVSEDGKRLIIDVPNIDPSLSGSIHDRFRSEVASLIGSERAAALQELSGELLETQMEGFGLSRVTYEVDLAPSQTGLFGQAIIKYSKRTRHVSSDVHSMAHSQVTREGAQKAEPLLDQLLPAEFGRKR